MDAIIGYLSAHPAVLVVIVILIVLLSLNFLIKNLTNFVLIAVLTLMAVFGYFYFKDPRTVSKIFSESVAMMKTGASDLVDKSKSFIKDSKELYKETKEAPGEVDKLLKESDEDTKKEFKK